MRSLQLLHLLIAALMECKAQTVKPCKHVHQLDINYVKGHSISVSCATTTHPLESLTVKLRRTDPVKDTLLYSDTSPASEHQRWTVMNEDGNVTLHLEDVRSSDEGLYDCQVHKDSDCLRQTRFNLTVGKCKSLGSVYAKPNSSVFLPCSEHLQQNRTDRVIWKVVNGHQSTEIKKYKQTNSTEKPLHPLYMRAKTQPNGSLLIMAAAHIDQLWYCCIVNEKTCYEVQLMMKDDHILTTSLETLSTTLLTTGSTDHPVGQIKDDNSDTSVASKMIAVTASIVSLCVLISLIVGLLHLKKRRDKINSQMTLNTRFSVHYSQVAEGFDIPLYSLVGNNTEAMTTFGVEQSEARASTPENLYEKI